VLGRAARCRLRGPGHDAARRAAAVTLTLTLPLTLTVSLSLSLILTLTLTRTLTLTLILTLTRFVPNAPLLRGDRRGPTAVPGATAVRAKPTAARGATPRARTTLIERFSDCEWSLGGLGP